jgi:hypothetical protein
VYPSLRYGISLASVSIFFGFILSLMQVRLSAVFRGEALHLGGEAGEVLPAAEVDD